MKLSIFASTFLAACFLFTASNEAHAKRVSIYVTNCILTGGVKRVLKAGIYDGNDGVKGWTRTDKKISYGDTKRMRCDPEGKGRCWLRAKPAHDGATAEQKTKSVKKNRYAKVTVSGGKTQISVYTSKQSCP